MYRLIPILLLSACLYGQAKEAPELARAVKDPDALARYIESHEKVEFSSVWKALGATPPVFAPYRCRSFTDASARCSAELIGIVNPDQVILEIQVGLDADLYLRYLKQPDHTWRFEGAQSFELYQQRRHEVDRSSGHPLLRVAGRGARGSDVSSEIEQWFDLTQPGFEPVFGFSPSGYAGGFCWAIGRSFHATASPTPDSIIVDLEVNLTLGDRNVGALSWRGVYNRPRGNKSYQIHSASVANRRDDKISPELFDAVANIDIEGGPSNETLIHYAMPELRRLASDPEFRKCEAMMLEKAKDTPDVRELRRLLR